MISKILLKQIRALHQKKNRELAGKYIIEGFKLFEEAIFSQPSNIERIIHIPELKNNIHFKGLQQKIPVDQVSTNDFMKISILENPQGIMAVMKKPVEKSDGNDNLVLMIDSVRDPGNLGTIIRIADWFGIGKIFCSSDTVDCYNPKVVQATMGSIFRVSLEYGHLNEFIDSLAGLGYTIYGTSLKGENIFNAKLAMPSVIILGSESHGVSENMLGMTQKNLYIPNFSKSEKKTESLNVSVSAAIICSEFRRRQ